MRPGLAVAAVGLTALLACRSPKNDAPLIVADSAEATPSAPVPKPTVSAAPSAAPSAVVARFGVRSLDGGPVSQEISEDQKRAMMAALEKLGIADISSTDSGVTGGLMMPGKPDAGAATSR